MTVAKFTQPNFLTQSASTYKAAIDAAISVLQQIGGDFAPHAMDSPNMQVVIDAGRIFKPGGTLTSVDQQTTGALVAPVSNPRIDRIVVDSEDGAYLILTGTEAASPTAPAVPNGKLPVCQIAMTVGMTEIANSIITDERTTYGPLAKLLRMPVEAVVSATGGFVREILLADRGILFDCDCSNGPVTIVLPDTAQAGNGFMIGVIKNDSTANAIVLQPSTTGEAFPDGATKTIAAQNGAGIVTTDGLGQWILAFDSSRKYDNVVLTGTVSNTPSGSGVGNTGYGTLALDALTTANGNTAVGYEALSGATDTGGNTAVGYRALAVNATGGTSNTAVGYDALFSNTSGQYNTAVGALCLDANTTGDYNVGVGARALGANTQGFYNAALGFDALATNATGSNNVAIGHEALSTNTVSNNVAIGYRAGGLITGPSAAQNVFIGSGAGYAGSISLLNCVFIGMDAGTTLTGGNSNVVLLGQNAEPSSGSVNDEITLGNSSITTLRCATTTITAISDRRDKDQIEDLGLGLNFIQTLKPRRFVWKMRDGSKVGVIDSGFIAQELKSSQEQFHADWLGVVYESNPDRLEATPGKLIPILVKAVQELSKKNEELEIRLSRLENVR